MLVGGGSFLPDQVSCRKLCADPAPETALFLAVEGSGVSKETFPPLEPSQNIATIVNLPRREAICVQRCSGSS